MRRIPVSLGLLLLLAGLPADGISQAAPAVNGAVHYYMTIFGSEGSPDLARESHTFATFAATEGGIETQELTISWLPAPGYFAAGNTMPPLKVVPGHNYDLDQTIALAPSHRVLYWGPYEIQPELFAQAVERVHFLASGRTNYKMFQLNLDQRIPTLHDQPGGTINCIMAVSDLGGLLGTGTSWGYPASRQVLAFLSRWIYDFPYGRHPEIASAMHLQERTNGTPGPF